VNKVLQVSQIARILVKDAQPLLLSTIGMDGAPRSRYIGAFRIRDTGEIFLISPSKTHKMQEVQRDPRVQVVLASKDMQRVLTLSGSAAVVQDMAVRKGLFEETKPLKIYPVFNDDFGVIHFIPLQAEYLDLNVRNDPFMVKIPG
jgi:general stress protein 26